MGIPQDRFHLRNGPVGGAYMPYQAHFDQLEKLVPGFHVPFVEIGFGNSAMENDIGFGWVVIRKRPMHQICVNIIQV